MFENDTGESLNNDLYDGPTSAKWNPGSQFAWKAPKTICRLAQIFCLLICSFCMMGVADFTSYETGNHTLLIVLFGMFYSPAMFIVDWANLYTFNLKLTHQLEFAMDFIFTNLCFFGACVLGTWCNSASVFNESVTTCQCLTPTDCEGDDFNTSASSTVHTIVAFLIFASFAFVGSTVLSYRFVASF